MQSIFRKFLFTCGLILISISTIYAQKNKLDPPRIAAGIKGGYYSSAVAFTTAPISQAPVAAPTFGVVFKYNAEKFFGLQLEATYNKIGWKEYNQENLTEFVYDRSMNYISVPALTNIYIGKKNFQFVILLGPQFDFLVGEQKEVIGDLNDQRYDYYEREANPAVVYLAGGVGFNILTKFGHFQFEGRFAASMTDVLKNADRSSTNRTTATVGGVTLSYILPISGWKDKPKEEPASDSGWEIRD
ncbi:porin family protein [Flammeovirga sp. SubArs3]|uniref:porin family protein n=1 Tax=Flammeovirga sp. SubArs3 TaxID=2995316 RepID=UPI00248C47B1|nr:porin family protein [Flammeovirga sp. SubArs3]